MFKQSPNEWQHGFDLTFANGWNISVKWGMDTASNPDRWLTTPDDEYYLAYKTAEVAAYYEYADEEDDWWDFKNNMVVPDQGSAVERNVGSDQVANMITAVKNIYLDEYSRWKPGIRPDYHQCETLDELLGW